MKLNLLAGVIEYVVHVTSARRFGVDAMKANFSLEVAVIGWSTLSARGSFMEKK